MYILQCQLNLGFAIYPAKRSKYGIVVFPCCAYPRSRGTKALNTHVECSAGDFRRLNPPICSESRRNRNLDGIKYSKTQAIEQTLTNRCMSWSVIYANLTWMENDRASKVNNQKTSWLYASPLCPSGIWSRPWKLSDLPATLNSVLLSQNARVTWMSTWMLTYFVLLECPSKKKRKQKGLPYT